MTIRALIVEDEPLARTRLRRLLESHPDVEIVAECSGVREALDVIGEVRPDLLFVDVQMPQESGFDLLHALGDDRQPVIIVTTAHSEYALEAFEADVADYLVKPFGNDRLTRALERARRLLAGGRGPAATTAPRRAAEQRRERFAVRARGEIIFVKASQIDWISSEGNYSRLHCGEASYLLRESMQSLDESLDPATFVRVHRSAIVNIDRVKKLVAGGDSAFSITLATGATVPLGPSYRGRLEQLVGQKL